MAMLIGTYRTDLGQDELSARVTLLLCLYETSWTLFARGCSRCIWLVSPCGDPFRDCHPNGALDRGSRGRVISLPHLKTGSASRNMSCLISQRRTCSLAATSYSLVTHAFLSSGGDLCGVSLSRLTFVNSSWGGGPECCGLQWMRGAFCRQFPRAARGHLPSHCSTLQHRLASHPYLYFKDILFYRHFALVAFALVKHCQCSCWLWVKG